MKKVKMGQLKDKEKENSLNEIRILASVNHPNIVAYKVLCASTLGSLLRRAVTKFVHSHGVR